tara:strand:- start:18168 stop:18500 length:333 start_codon:yes stop_codon:yes gene_type:complete
MKVKQLKASVKNLLIEWPELRDNDNSLCTQIWREELKDQGISVNDNVYSFFKKYANGHLSLAPSIKRVRAKLQEDHKELRGTNYSKRKTKLQDEWKDALGYQTDYETKHK